MELQLNTIFQQTSENEMLETYCVLTPQIFEFNKTLTP